VVSIHLDGLMSQGLPHIDATTTRGVVRASLERGPSLNSTAVQLSERLGTIV